MPIPRPPRLGLQKGDVTFALAAICGSVLQLSLMIRQSIIAFLSPLRTEGLHF